MDNRFNKSLLNIPYYNRLNTILEREVGDFLRSKVPNPKNYSNDLRHQYTSAMYAKNKGGNTTRNLGRLHEWFNISELEPYNTQDKRVDLYNNDVGIQYANKYRNLSNKELLQKLFDDYYVNRNNRLKELGY